MPGLFRKPDPNAEYESPEDQKIALEIAKLIQGLNTRFAKRLQVATPLLSVLVAAGALAWSAYIQSTQLKDSGAQFRQQQQEAQDRFLQEQQATATRFQQDQQAATVRFQEQQREENRQFVANLRQAEERQQDEIFYKAIERLNSSVSLERVSAITTLADFSQHSVKRREQATPLLIVRLQQESDLTILALLSRAVGDPSLDILVQKNRSLSGRLARATGRLLGIEAARGTISVKKDDEHPLKSRELIRVYAYKQLPQEILRVPQVWQDASASDVGFFQIPDQLLGDSALQTAFEREASSRHANLSDENNAENEFQSSIHDLWINTQAIVHVLESASIKGKLDDADLSQTILIHPTLAGIDLTGTCMSSVIWMAPVLRNSTLSFANLSNSEMKYADLYKAKLRGANIANVNFGQQDKAFEDRTSKRIRFLQNDVDLDGANVWELEQSSYLFNRLAGSKTQQELENRRGEIQKTPEAKKHGDKCIKR